MLCIHIFALNEVYWLKNRRNLKKFLPFIFVSEGFKLESLNLILCSDEYLLEVNKQYLQHNYYTDIITFSMLESNELISGELYISIERVIDNASQLKISKIIELHRVIFHGCLHLCGYGDKTDAEIAIIRQKEDYYLDKYFS